jgi:hypothetical protein
MSVCLYSSDYKQISMRRDKVNTKDCKMNLISSGIDPKKQELWMKLKMKLQILCTKTEAPHL